jgi:hypothetical protein
MQEHFSNPRKNAIVTSIMVNYSMQSPCGLNYGIYGRRKDFFHLDNSLYEHLHLVACMHAKPFYTMGTFPYDNAIIARMKRRHKKVLA